ncbi:MAG TPA: hypothetical protein VM029_05700 [Opitutaceae bacterium]|nr:hypothetical protein [Opitutaceae bacterium]
MRPFLLLALVTMALIALPASRAADPTWHLNVQAYSFHEHTTQDYLYNTTPGVGLIRRQDNWLLGAGVFRNSIGRWAGYGYGGYQLPVVDTRAGPVRVGGIAGVTHHYFFNDGGIVPLAAAVVTVPLTRTIAVDLVGIPRIKNATYATLNLSLSWQFR